MDHECGRAARPDRHRFRPRRLAYDWEAFLRIRALQPTHKRLHLRVTRRKTEACAPPLLPIETRVPPAKSGK
jgi:hypothetical protein